MGAGGLHEIGRQEPDHASDQGGAAGGAIAASRPVPTDEPRDLKRFDRLLLCQRQPVLEVVRLLRNLIGPVHELRLERPARLEPETVPKVERKGKGPLPDRVLEDPLPNVVCEVQTRLVVAFLQTVHDPDRLVVVLEASGVRVALPQKAVEDSLARVAERSVTQIVAERDRLGQVLVQEERPGGAARDLRDFDRMRQPRSEMVPFVRDEDLCLVLQTPEGPGVDDPVPVVGVLGPAVPSHRPKRAAGAVGSSALGGIDRKPFFLEPFEGFLCELHRRRRHERPSSSSPARSKARASPTR